MEAVLLNSRRIEEAIMAYPVFEGTEEKSGPRYIDSRERRTGLLIRPLNRSVCEPTLCGNAVDQKVSQQWDLC